MIQTIYFIALGCPKNQVDTERMLGLAQQLGFQGVPDASDADVIVINTCGFITSAKEESIETILELAQYKENRCHQLVVAGCLAQRHADELALEMPEVDHFIGAGDLEQLKIILNNPASARASVRPPGSGADESNFERALLGNRHIAFLKIAEGCDRRCAFCIIPRLRGPQRSRTVPSLVDEARTLIASGVRELILVAQDTTAYGRDLTPSPRLADLLSALDQLEQLRWIRILYTYPAEIDHQLIQALATLPRVVPYLDIPFQHIDDQVLRCMHRGYTGQQVRRVIQNLRQAIPAIYLRGTVITGHPGETSAAHQYLLQFIQEMELDHLGVFTFSPEEGTIAAAQPNEVPTELAEERAQEVLELQLGISQHKLARHKGQTLEVLVDGISSESEYLMEGHHAGQAPEIDGVVILSNCTANAGDFVSVQVIDSGDYDLIGSPVGAECPAG